MNRKLCFLIIFLSFAASLFAVEGDRIVVYGEYPVVKELGKGAFEQKEAEGEHPLINYDGGEGYSGKALIEASHFLSANVYGYTFIYKPGSTLMKTEETFEVGLRGEAGMENTVVIGEGVRNNIYRVKLGFTITPSVRRWLNAFQTTTIRFTEAEGTSDFYSGWEGRSDALREALRNLVLIAAKRSLSSKPLLLKGDILLKGNPYFSVGAGRHYCKVQGFVNFVEIVTYD